MTNAREPRMGSTIIYQLKLNPFWVLNQSVISSPNFIRGYSDLTTSWFPEVFQQAPLNLKIQI